MVRVTGRPMAIATTMITAILGILLLIILPTNGGPVGDVVSTVHLLVAAALPIFILVSLLAPKPVREFFAQQQEVRPANTAAYEWTSPDRKSTRLNSSHVAISYAVFCSKKKNESCLQTLMMNVQI